MSSRRTIAGLLTLALVTTTAPSEAAEGPLEGTAPILQQTLWREGRVEIGPRFGTTFGDTYEQNILSGLSATYFIWDWLGVGAEVDYGISLDTALHEDINAALRGKRDAVCPSALGDQQSQCLGELGVTDSIATSSIELLALGTATILPIQGKIMLPGTTLIRFDMHLLVGMGMGLIRGEGGLEDDSSMAPMVGLGTRFLVSDWVALHLGVRDVLLKYHKSADQDGQEFDSTFHNHFELSLGVGFLFPTVPQTTTVD